MHDNVLCGSRAEPETDRLRILDDKVRRDGVLLTKVSIDLVVRWGSVLHLQGVKVASQLRYTVSTRSS